jgi:hypothetical protein
LEHHVEADVAALAMVKRSGDRPEDLEPELLPEMDGCVVGLDHRVELHAEVAIRFGPIVADPRIRSSLTATTVLPGGSAIHRAWASAEDRFSG